MAIVEGMVGLQNFPIQKWVIMALFYLAGAVVYVARVPEKLSPGTFDIWVSEIREDPVHLERVKEKTAKLITMALYRAPAIRSSIFWCRSGRWYIFRG